MGDTIGERIKQIREARGWSQRQLGARAGLTGAYISLLESGGRSDPGVRLLQKIARAFAIPLVELLEDDMRNLTDEKNAMLDFMKRAALFYGGPNADWTELRDTVTAIYAIKDPVKRKQEIAYLLGLAARQGQPPNTLNEPGAAYTTNEHDAL